MKRAWLTREVIDTGAILSLVSGDGVGASTLFVGNVRNTNDGRDVEGIEYTAYDRMALAELERIVDEAVESEPGLRIAVVHRLGELRIGEASVAIACAHAHRAPVLAAERYVIEELKRRVPIWKKEWYVDGTREWVDPTRASTESRA